MNQDPGTIAWRKSSYSASGNDCVELGSTTDGIAIRNSKHPHDGTIVVTPAALRALLDSVRAGESHDL